MYTEVRITTRLALALGALLCAGLALMSESAWAADARFEAASADGSVVFFTTDEAPLLLGDTDLKSDVYMRAYDSSPGIEDFVTRKVSTGPGGGNNAIDAFFVGASEDGSRAFFSTRESLVVEDTDHAVDVYLRDTVNSTTTLLSQGEVACQSSGCGNAEVPASFVQRGVTPDGSQVFFITTERLTVEDGDNVSDVYVRDVDAGTTVLVSRGDSSCEPTGCGDGDVPVLGFEDVSVDGNKVVFRTAEDMTGADNDGGAPDLYQRNLLTGATLQISVPGECPACVPSYGASSDDGAHVVFETSGALDPADSDAEQDVYDWSGGTATLVSIGPVGGNGEESAVFPGVVSAFPGISADGSRIVFETAESLVGADDDGGVDVYERSGGFTALVSRRDPACEPPDCGPSGLPATFRWMSPDDSDPGILFGTAEPLVSDDEDERQDVYLRSGGETILVSAGAFGGDGEFNASFTGASHDGSHVFILTTEQLAPLDSDGSADIYDISGSTATLISIGPAGGNGPFGAGLTGTTAVSEDGSHVFFTTDERLTVDDKDLEERDVYRHTATGTLLVSTGNAVQLGPAPPSQLSTDPASPGASTTPSIKGNAEPGSSIQVYADASCSGEPLRTGTAEALSGGGIQMTVASGSTTSFWLSAEAEGITSDCAGPVTYKHSGGVTTPPSGESGGGLSEDSGGSSPRPKRGDSVGEDRNPGIAYVRPVTRITFGPSFRTLRRKVVFRFTDETGQPNTRFSCKLDRRRWRRCSSPFKLAKLSVGPHVFRVRGVNGAGERETVPAKRRFRVVAR
jgi:Tol biopolymer transport system component